MKAHLSLCILMAITRATWSGCSWVITLLLLSDSWSHVARTGSPIEHLMISSSNLTSGELSTENLRMQVQRCHVPDYFQKSSSLDFKMTLWTKPGRAPGTDISFPVQDRCCSPTGVASQIALLDEPWLFVGPLQGYATPKCWSGAVRMY